MKLLTLNTHSLLSEDNEDNLIEFVRVVLRECPDIIALQEVNQSIKAECVTGFIDGMIDNGAEIKNDNFAYRVSVLLKEAGANYYWIWMPIKVGYGIYDEGVALFSKFPITNFDFFTVSQSDSYYNFKTRKVLGVEVSTQWFYSIHLGWWNDKLEGFMPQWKRLIEELPMPAKIWLMGDFNNAAHVRDEGYDYIVSQGWYDTYDLANMKDDGFTVAGNIDGWRMQNEKMRIDYIFCNFKANIRESRIVFNDKTGKIISDHYGIIIETNQ